MLAVVLLNQAQMNSDPDVEPVEKSYRSSPAGKKPVRVPCPTDEIPEKIGYKTARTRRIFLKSNF